MNGVIAVRVLLVADTGVTALVPAVRIVAGMLPQGGVGPGRCLPDEPWSLRRNEETLEMITTSPLKRLRKSLWLRDVPEILTVPAMGDDPAAYIPTEEATLDEVAFAEVAISRQASALNSIAYGLAEIVKRARRQGAHGYDNAVAAALRDLESGK